jgi:3-methyladenine DNA glycosylase AlkD
MNNNPLVNAKSVKADLSAAASPPKAEFLPHFFKTGKGEYGEGDKFIGVIVPKQRIIAKKYITLPLSEIQKLLENQIHECRLTALLVLVSQFARADEPKRKILVDFYLHHTNYINNWDLVDLSAEYILGEYYLDRKKDVLYRLAKSENLWERRIAMISTFWFIRQNRFSDAVGIATILVHDRHDLIQKAVGWMLREIGKRDKKAEIDFLKIYYQTMPRTMLRYAMEKFSEAERVQIKTEAFFNE